MYQTMSRGLIVTTALAMAAILAGSVQAQNGTATASHPGTLFVYGNDQTHFFSDDGISKAKQALAKHKFAGGLEVTFDLFAKPPHGEVPADKEQRAKFFRQLARELAVADKAKGIYVLITRSPGYVQVLADQATVKRGFSSDDEKQLSTLLLEGFRKAAQIEKEDKQKAIELRDEALLRAVEFIARDLEGTTPPVKSNDNSGGSDRSREGQNSLAGWICLGLVALLAVWLIVGLIRALSGAGSAAAGPGAGGAGGGGFLSSLLGGLFGAMAGMWLYNHLFGGSSMLSGHSALPNDSPTPDAGGGIEGEGDFSGDTGAGGSFDDGGGTDTGGDWGGGDWGGGDFGGDAGGDF